MQALNRAQHNKTDECKLIPTIGSPCPGHGYVCAKRQTYPKCLVANVLCFSLSHKYKVALNTKLNSGIN